MMRTTEALRERRERLGSEQAAWEGYDEVRVAKSGMALPGAAQQA